MKRAGRIRRISAGILAVALFVISIPSVSHAEEGIEGMRSTVEQETAFLDETEQKDTVFEEKDSEQEENTEEEEEKDSEQEGNTEEEEEKDSEREENTEEEEKDSEQEGNTEEEEEKGAEQEENTAEEKDNESEQTGVEETEKDVSAEEETQMPNEEENTAAKENESELLDEGEAALEETDMADEKEEDEPALYASQDLTEYQVSGGSIYINSDGNIAKCDEFVTEVIIPESIAGKTVAGIANNAFQGCGSLRKVTVEGRLSSLGWYAFKDCISLEEVNFIQGVAEIQNYAFQNCKSLGTVMFFGKTAAIGDDAFYGCTGLKTITLPEGLSSTGNNAFNGCSNLQSVVIPSGVTKIEQGCFTDCSSLYQISIPESVTTIERYAFNGCKSLPQIVFSPNIVEVGSNAFQNCTGLQRVTVEGRLSSLGWYAFKDCTSLEEVNFIQGVAEIGNYAFQNCKSLGTVMFSGKTAAIGDDAFYGCTGLKTITLPEGLSSTGNNAFNGCSNLQSVIIPSGVTKIDQGCFTDCSSLSQISIPESVTTIERYAFSGCKSLPQIAFPQNVVEVGSNAFQNCTGLQRVTVKGRLSSLGWYAFKDCTSLEEVNFTQGVTEIGNYAFQNCKSLSDIYVLGRLTIVGQNAFYNCNALSDVYYYGTEQQWQDVQINASGNQMLLKATKHYNFIYQAYTVTFDMQGHGTPIGSYTDITPNSTVNLPMPFEEGYLFDGWYTQEKGGGEKAVSPYKVSQSITLYANWISMQPVVCIVTFDMQGHGQSIDPYTGIAVGDTIVLPPEPKEQGYLFGGWYTRIDGVEKKFTSQSVVTQDIVLYAKWIMEMPTEDMGDVLVSDIPADGKIPTGLWIADIDDTTYTGMAIQPDVHVYDKNVRLRAGTDYTIRYKNNIKAAKPSDQKAPTVIVNGKGNYSGKETAVFTILPVPISGTEVYAMNVQVRTSRKAQKPVPVLYYMGTKLVNKKDFTVSYMNASGVYAEAGTYGATVTGKGNYAGTRSVIFTAVNSTEKSKPYNIAKAKLAGFQTKFSYTGQPCIQQCTLTIKNADGSERTLVEGIDYKTWYVNNEKAGKATVTYCGRNGLIGRLKKSYKILPYNIKEDTEKKISYDALEPCDYAKGGSKPKPSVYFNGICMKAGIDYTLSYKNNKMVGGSKTPTVIVAGKGSFKGKLEIGFVIKSQDLSRMTLVSADKVYANKTGVYKIKPKLMDIDGKLLSPGKDFDKNSIVYTYENDVVLENGVAKNMGDAVEEADIIPAGTQIRITMNKGSGNNYSGQFSGLYKIVQASISSAKVTIPRQDYTGEAIEPYSQIVVKVSGKELREEDYEIIGYKNNINKGKATVIIAGRGNYGGTKNAGFQIGAKVFLWWWK